MPAPLVSVLLPARDAAPTLDACLRSVARQSTQDWECVVVDDRSADATGALAARFAASDARFRVVPGPGHGLVPALHAGLAACRGRFVARMDADDLMCRDRLHAQAAVLAAEPALAAVGCHVRIFPRASMRDGLRAYERWLNRMDSQRRVREEAFVECPVVHPTLMVRRDVLTRLGYRDMGWPEDYDLVLRMLAGGHDVGMVPRRLLSWRDRPDRLTRTDPRYALDRLTACRAAFLASGLLADVDEYVLWGYGDTGRALRRALLAHDKRPSHVVEVHRGRLGNLIHGAPVVPPEALAGLAPCRVVASVAGEEPRRQIRAFLVANGFFELRDFVCAA
jgi:glycosyltransferase involved in cell wall biosynthesis